MRRPDSTQIEEDVSWLTNPFTDEFKEGLEAHRRLAELILEFDRRGITYEKAKAHMLFSLGRDFTEAVWNAHIAVAEGRKPAEEIARVILHAAEVRQSGLN